MSVAFPQEIREGLSAALSNVYSWPDAAIAVFQSYVRFGEAVRSPSIATMGAKQNFKLRHYPILTIAESVRAMARTVGAATIRSLRRRAMLAAEDDRPFARIAHD